jgi:hypothetical protein
MWKKIPFSCMPFVFIYLIIFNYFHLLVVKRSAIGIHLGFIFFCDFVIIINSHLRCVCGKQFRVTPEEIIKGKKVLQEGANSNKT